MSAIPLDSVWYAWGHHWKVTAYTKVDGQPGVYTRCLTSKGKAPTMSVMSSRLSKYGERKS